MNLKLNMEAVGAADIFSKMFAENRETGEMPVRSRHCMQEEKIKHVTE
jgi:hypothetical protein